jgi:hypothetical protein
MFRFRFMQGIIIYTGEPLALAISTDAQSTKQKRRNKKNSTEQIRGNCKVMGHKEIQSIAKFSMSHSCNSI